MTAVAKPPICDVCATSMLGKIEDFLFTCPGCQLWRSSLQLRLEDGQAAEICAQRANYAALRRRNFGQILGRLGRQTDLKGKSILDVGCAQGWFLEAAEAVGMRAVGIEPEPTVAADGVAKGLTIRAGLFPQVLDASERFDFIIFNDVFEHLEKPSHILDVCYRHLAPGGQLILNLPDSQGFVFRVAAALRLRSLLRRLWQVDFYSPHLYYYNRSNLRVLAKRAGFARRDIYRVDAIRVSGLWERLGLDKESSRLKKFVLFGVASLAAPLLNHVMPSDISVMTFERA
jgi:SAM-dependent methyltransferase